MTRLKRDRAACGSISVQSSAHGTHGASGLDISHRHRDDCSVVHKRIRALPSTTISSKSLNNIKSTSVSSSSHQPPPSKSSDCINVNKSPVSVSNSPNPATQLQFYGFYSTTAFDRAILSHTETILLAAEMAADFYSEASMLLDMISDIKVHDSEAASIDELMRRMGSVVGDDSRLPVDPQQAAAHANVIQSIYSGLVRVYVFLLQRYHREFVALEVGDLLAACWQRLLAFAAEYKILEEEFVQKVFDFVHKITTSTPVPPVQATTASTLA